jgi:methylmalonyl-CoA/ethylmalonyl-CoA epimerase
MKIHHVGYAVHSVSKAAENMKVLGFVSVGSIFDDEKRNVRILFVNKESYFVELIEPMDLNRPSPIDGILAKKMPGPYHFCYEVDCIAESVEKLKMQSGWIVIEPPSFAGALGSKVVFLFEKTLGIIELVERKV